MPASTPPDGDLLHGSNAIRAFLVQMGMPENVSIYYLKRVGRWPIGNTHEGNGIGGRLIASKQRLIEYADKITRGAPPLGRHRIITKIRLGRHAKKTAARPKRRGERANQQLLAE
jgi:hypothetical protein